MPPLIAGRVRLALYLAAWAAVAALLAAALAGTRTLSFPAALAVTAPPCLLHAFVCLSPWYVCRAMPLLRSSLARVLLAHGLSAALAGALFAALAQAFRATIAPGPLFDVVIPMWAAGTLLYAFSVALDYLLLSAQQAKEVEARALEARMLARDAELRALRGQVNPHFLFNSLNTISALTTVDAARARETCVRLADYLRATLAIGEREAIPLAEELRLAESYLAIEQVRFGSRLQLAMQLEPGCQECAVPALLLQPLVENAVKHGVAAMLEGGWIRLRAGRAETALEIAIENACEPAEPRAGGLGLANVQRRLQVRFGSAAAFQAGADGGVFRVILRVPCA